MSVRYNRGKARIATAGWSNMDVRALVLAGASVPAGAEEPDLDTVADLLAVSGVVEAAEVGALSGYVRKSTTETVTQNDTDNVADLGVGDLAYAETESGVWRAVVFYEEGASDAARNLISLHTITPLVTNGGPVDIVEGTLGIIGQG